MTIKIVTDSTSDLPDSMAREYGIYSVPCFINIEGKSYRDRVDMSRNEFYSQINNWKTPPTTATPSPAMFEQTYQQALDDGATGIISVHVSEKLSNVVNVARLAARSFEEKVKIHVIDSGQLSMGIGLMARAAAELARQGEQVDEVVRKVMLQGKRIYTYAMLGSLDYLKRSGRVANLGANIFSVLKINPVISMNAGKVKLEMQRTTKNAVKHLVNVAGHFAPLREVVMLHTNAEAMAASLLDEIRPYLADGLQVEFAEVTPVIGAHIGNGAFGFTFEASAVE